jgi:hypothetical protein
LIGCLNPRQERALDQAGDRPHREQREPGGEDAGEGVRTREGQSQAKIAGELYPVVENLLDELDRWFSGTA